MKHKEAIRYLESFIDYEKIGYIEKGVFNLERMNRLAGIFGNPERSFPAIHIAGTKGKGSVASFVSNILREAGFRVGLYTSPHLFNSRERIKINGKMISKADLASVAGEMKEKLEKKKPDFSPTFFEAYTILAFNYFKAKKIDLGVIEAGLGGRLDATNIVRPLISVITPVSYDHTHILGDTLEKIASEKSGIIKKGCVCVSAPQEKEALHVIRKRCESVGAELVLVGKDIGFKEVRCDAEKEIFDVRGAFGEYKNCIIRLLGHHQVANAACGVGIAEALKKKGINLSEENIKEGLEKTENPARCEVIAKNPYTVLDGAQNKESAAALKNTVKRNFSYEQLVLVLGISKEKDAKGLCDELLPLADTLILTKAKIERAEKPEEIQKFTGRKDAILTDSVAEAMKKAREASGAGDMILVTGSLFVAGEAWTRR